MHRERGNSYPRNGLNVILHNRFTAVGGLLILLGIGREVLPKSADLDTIKDFMLLTGLGLLFITRFGRETLESYKNTIDAYRIYGDVPDRYKAMYTEFGMYCDKRGFTLAMKDIEKGRVTPDEYPPMNNGTRE